MAFEFVVLMMKFAKISTWKCHLTSLFGQHV